MQSSDDDLLAHFSPHLPLWFVYTFFFVFLVLLLPCLWVSYIWDQIIDPHYEMDQIEEPQNSVIRYVQHNDILVILVGMWYNYYIA